MHESRYPPHLLALAAQKRKVVVAEIKLKEVRNKITSLLQAEVKKWSDRPDKKRRSFTQIVDTKPPAFPSLASLLGYAHAIQTETEKALEEAQRPSIATH